MPREEDEVRGFEVLGAAFFGAGFFAATGLDEDEELLLFADEPLLDALLPLLEDFAATFFGAAFFGVAFLAAVFLGAAFFAAPFLLAGLDDLLREEELLDELLRDFFEAAFLLAPPLDFLAAAFFTTGLLAVLFLAALFFEVVFLAATFLPAAFLGAVLLPEPELRLEEEDPRPDAFLAALFLAGAFDEDLLREDLLPPFFAAAFLVDFAILNWDLMRVNKFSFLKLR